jgi:L-iditol 2-dehydrogenase
MSGANPLGAVATAAVRAAPMRALVWEGPRQMVLRELPVPEPGPGEVCLRVEAVGICGSELAGYLGHNSLRKPPLVMGHEFAGTVDAVGDLSAGAVGRGFPLGSVGSASVSSGSWSRRLADDSGVSGTRWLAPGVEVVVNPLLHCGSCRACRHGRFNLCERRELIGAHRPGAFAEYVLVPAAACLPVPRSRGAGADSSAAIAIAVAAMAEPVACAVRAVRLAGVGLGDRLLVLGGGPIGLLCARLAALAGATVALSDTNPARLEMARAWGVELPMSAEDAGDPAAVSSVFTGGAPDAAIDAVGLELTRRSAIRAVRRGGSVVFIGLHETGASFDGNDLVRNEVVVRGCFAYSPADFETACTLLATGALPGADSWLSQRPLDEGASSFAELVDTQPDVLKIVLRP